MHRGFWFIKAFLLFGLIVSTLWVDNSAMSAYRWFAFFSAGLFMLVMGLILIDFAYWLNEKGVDLDDQDPDSDEKRCNWKTLLLISSGVVYALTITMWVVMAQWFGKGDACGVQQALITITIIINVSLSIVSISKIAPHGTLLTSSVLSFYTTFQCYGALMSHTNDQCNHNLGSSAFETFFGYVWLFITICFAARYADAANANGTLLMGKAGSAAATGNSDLTVTLDAGAGSSSETPAAEGATDKTDEEEIGKESWWAYHFMMVIVSLYFAMLLTNWSTQPVEKASEEGDWNHSLEAFWVKIISQWFTLGLYAWTLIGPYLLKDVRDFGIEFD
jgi:hypothetical protein